MKKFLISNNWWFYFILTFLISWPIWIIGSIFLPQELRVITLIIGGFGPFCSALLIIWLSEGKESLAKWLRTLFNFRIPLFWYLLGGILAPLAIASIHHLVYIALGGQSGIDLSLEWLGYFAYLISTALLTGGNEEPGWRGYITPVLARRFNIIITNIVVGVLWALWHLPMYFAGDWGGDSQPFVWLVVYCIPLSMILTWLYYKSKRSIIPVMLLHAGTNVVFRYFPMETEVFTSVADEFTVIKAIVYWIVAIILIVATKGTLGYIKQED